MAGRGPAPKETSARRRRGEPMRGEWRDCPPVADPPVLPLADPDWPGETRALWEGWRADGATTLWTPADLARARDTILLHATASSSKAAEIRLREDSLGLSQKGKRDLRLRVTEDASAETRPAAEVHRLRVVDP